MEALIGQITNIDTSKTKPEIVILDSKNDKSFYQVRRKNLIDKLSDLSTQDYVSIKFYKGYTETFSKGVINRFNNLILTDIQKVGVVSNY